MKPIKLIELIVADLILLNTLILLIIWWTVSYEKVLVTFMGSIPRSSIITIMYHNPFIVVGYFIAGIVVAICGIIRIVEIKKHGVNHGRQR